MGNTGKRYSEEQIISILKEAEADGAKVSEALKAETEKAGITFVYEITFEATTDFRFQIAAARETSPDVYFIEAFNPALDILGPNSETRVSGTWLPLSHSR